MKNESKTHLVTCFIHKTLYIVFTFILLLFPVHNLDFFFPQEWQFHLSSKQYNLLVPLILYFAKVLFPAQPCPALF